MGALTDWETLSQEALQDRRRGKRVPLTYSIEVSGFDRGGRLFTERTSTWDVSEDGCCFRVKTPLQRGDVVAINLVSRQHADRAVNRSLLFQIMWTAQERDGWNAGAMKLQPESIWHATFPRKERSRPSA